MMKRVMALALVALFGVMSTGIDHAEAKRFGGGISFGKQRMVQPQQSFSQRQALPQKSGQRGSARPGLMGAIAGLALGGMLGALFFGGAFEGINLFDIVILGIIAFFIISLLKRRAAGMARPMAYAGASGQPAYGNEQGFGMPQGGQMRGQVVRPQIDEQHFTAAARDIFMRMQAAWDKRNMEDIHRFCTRDVVAKIAQDMNTAGDHESRTEIGMLDAAILDAWVESDAEWVAIHFTAMLREQTLDATGAAIEDRSHEVNETWIFTHNPAANDPTWYLAGIQQA